MIRPSETKSGDALTIRSIDIPWSNARIHDLVEELIKVGRLKRMFVPLVDKIQQRQPNEPFHLLRKLERLSIIYMVDSQMINTIPKGRGKG